jgi:hypothetical protein
MKKHTEEEARRIAEEEETRAERQNRRERYYGSDGNSTQYKRHPHIFLFRPEDLDNPSGREYTNLQAHPSDSRRHPQSGFWQCRNRGG